MRNTATVIIPQERLYRRDSGKVFFITEMPASQGEWWAIRVFLSMAKNGLDIPEGLMYSGWQGLAVFGIRALGLIHKDDAEPLLKEMMACLQIIPNPSNTNVMRKLVDDGSNGEDIDEISTRGYLRREIFRLHADFLQPVAESTSASATATGDAMQTT